MSLLSKAWGEGVWVGMSGEGPQLGAGKGVGAIASDVSAKNPLSVGHRTPKTPRPPGPPVEDSGAGP